MRSLQNFLSSCELTFFFSVVVKPEDAFLQLLNLAIDKGNAQIYIKNSQNDGALHYACMNSTGKPNLTAVNWLIEKGAKIDLRNK